MDPRRGCRNLLKNPLKMVEAWIISSGEGKVKGVTGGAEGGVRVMESSGWLFLNQGDRITMGGKGLGLVISVGVNRSSGWLQIHCPRVARK